MDDQTLLQLAQSVLAQRGPETPKTVAAVLNIPVAEVLSGQTRLSPKQREKLRYLFTDYEWMLAQKIAVLETSDPQEGGPAARYEAAKLTIAKAWLHSPLLATNFSEQPLAGTSIVQIHLQLRLDYGQHGLSDLLDFVISKNEAKQLQTQKLDLLTWAKQQG